MPEPPGFALREWLMFLGLSDCTCSFAWRSSLGVLDRIDMMGGWVRVGDGDNCPHHLVRPKRAYD